MENEKDTNAAANADIAIEASLKTSGLGSAECDDMATSNGDSNGGGGGGFTVPVIDLTSANASEQLWNAAHDVGFFTIVGHGIDLKIIQNAFEISEWYFQQSLEIKQQTSPFDARNNAGFEYYTQVRPSTGIADQKESLQITARKDCMDGRWPSTDFQNKSTELLVESHKLAQRLLDMLQPYALPEETVDKTVMSKSHTLWSETGQCTLRFLHYPPTPSFEATQKLLADGYWRAGPHTDWSNLTLLFQQVGQNGLECCANPRRLLSGSTVMKWIPVEPVYGGIAVNIGDMLSRWSNNRLYSNLHRVRLPSDTAHLASRYSIAFFAQSDKETIIGSKSTETDDGQQQRPPPITAGDYILSRIKSNFQASISTPTVTTI